MDTVQCTLDAMDAQVSLEAVPRRRALIEYQRGKLDGIFAFSPTLGLLKHGQASQPVALQKWYLLSRHELPQDEAARIGVLGGSRESLWLAKHGYWNRHGVDSPQQLLMLLAFDRVDAILADWKTLTHHRDQLPSIDLPELDELPRRFVRFNAMHLLLHDSAVADHPDFIQEFNRHLKPCVVTKFDLLEHERAQIRALAQTKLDDLADSIDLQRAVLDQGYYHSLVELLIQDRIWEARPLDRPTLLAERILANPNSLALREWQERQGGFVTEVFLMDSIGANTAMSQMTSDVWQGNERKYLEILDLAPGEVFVKPIYFDESTGRFQVMTASPVHDNEGRFLGGVALALDLERVMLESEYDE